MKKFISRIVAALLVATSLAGCSSTIKQESATEWMARQPAFTR